MVKFPSICSDIAVDDNNMTKNSEITGGKIKRHPSMKINIGDFISTSKKKI